MENIDKEKKLNEIKQICLNCKKCPLYKTRINLVFGDGDINSKIMFIGEAPGEKEDLSGIPFVGRAGKQLDKFLKKIGLKREQIYIANILKCRPPKNRDPNKEEIIACTPNLISQIKTIKPKILVPMGNYATKFVLSGFSTENMENIKGISVLRGKPKKLKFKNNFEIIVLPIYHPAVTLYRPQLLEDFEKDFILLKRLLREIN